MVFDSVAVDERLLVLKIAFLVLLYLFIWRIVRTASRDLRLPQESFILAPSAAAGVRGPDRPGHRPPRRRQERGPQDGEGFELDSAQLTIGRGRAERHRDRDATSIASARHARFEPRRDGVWVQDLGSTNGTFVNGDRLDRPRRLAQGDIVRVGETELRYENEARPVSGAVTRPRSQAPSQRGRLRRRAPALRGRRRDGGAQAGEVASRLAAAALRRAARTTGGRAADRRPDPGGQSARVRPLEPRPERLRHGDDDDRCARRERAGRLRACR